MVILPMVSLPMVSLPMVSLPIATLPMVVAGLPASGLAVALAVLAVLLWVRRPSGVGVDRRLLEPKPERRPGRRPTWWGLALGAGVFACMASLALLGPRSAVLVATALIVGGCVVRLVERHRRMRTALRARAEVARACSALASRVRVGSIPAEALSSAAEDCPILAASARTLALGGNPVPHWLSHAHSPGQQGLADLARAWEVSYQTGAPLATALDQVAEALTSDAEIRRLVAGEVAAPRATAKIMSALPFLGIAIGYAIGGRPLDFLLSGPFGWVCLVGGVTLAAAGIAWIERLARSAAEEG